MQVSGNTSEIAPRQVPTRDEKYMGLAFIHASFSKDPNTQHGSQIVTCDNYPLGSGYNGPPAQYDDVEMDWSRPYKYKNIIHSEINAIDHSDRNRLTGAIIYVTGKPCAACMLKIVAAGIAKVVYFSGRVYDGGSMMLDKKIFEDADEIAEKGGVIVEAFSGNLDWLSNRIKQLENMGVFRSNSKQV